MNKNLVLHQGMTGREMAAVLESFVWPLNIDSDVCYETLRFAQDMLLTMSRGDYNRIRAIMESRDTKNYDETEVL